jgi:hypothetical protein
MSDKQLMQWMLLVDIGILLVLSIDVYLSYQRTPKQGGQ